MSYETFNIIGWIIGIVITLIGILIFIKKRDKIDIKEIWTTVGILIFLGVFDSLSTIYFMNRIGIGAEGNIIVKWLCYQIGIIPGLVVHKLICIPMLFFAFTFFYYVYRGDNFYKFFKWIIIIIAAVVPIHNMLYFVL